MSFPRSRNTIRMQADNLALSTAVAYNVSYFGRSNRKVYCNLARYGYLHVSWVARNNYWDEHNTPQCRRSDIMEWCEEMYGSEFRHLGKAFIFKSVENAVMFKLRWG